jgi:hypothetical protein
MTTAMMPLQLGQLIATIAKMLGLQRRLHIDGSNTIATRAMMPA